jgi:hypothetical protein
MANSQRRICYCVLLRRQGLDGLPASLQCDRRYRLRMSVRWRRPGYGLQPGQVIAQGAVAAEACDGEIADCCLQPAQTLGIAQASHGGPLPGRCHECGLN